MIEVHIQYDDREKFPWLLWVGNYLFAKYRNQRGAALTKSALEKFLREAHKTEEHCDD